MARQKDYLGMLLALFVFMIINIPSIKLIYSSSLINMITLIGFYVLGILRLSTVSFDQFFLKHTHFYFILIFILFWTSIFSVTMITKPSTFEMENMIQYISVVLFSIGIIFFVERKDLKYIFWLQLLWGLLISVLEMTISIPKDRSLGQHYLISGVAIGITIVMVIGYLLSEENSVKNKILLLPLLMILFGGVTSLKGRAPILLSLGVPALILIPRTLCEKNKTKKIRNIIIYTSLFFILVLLVSQFMNEETFQRFSRLFVSIKDEPRYVLYSDSINIIQENLFGIGLSGQEKYGINYPHNLFLEVIMTGGILSLTVLLVLGIIIFKNMLVTFKARDNSTIWMSIMLYMFITWNISFSLSGSYMLFTATSLYLVSSNSYINLK